MAELICDKIARLENKVAELEFLCRACEEKCANSLTQAEVDREIHDLLKYICPKCVETLRKVAAFRSVLDPEAKRPAWGVKQ